LKSESKARPFNFENGFTSRQRTVEQFIQDTKTLARKLTHKHGGCITTLATLYYLSHEYLDRLGQQHNTDMRPFIAVLTQAMGYWSIANGFTRQQCSDALANVERTMLTARHLAALTDDLLQIELFPS
jgi:hypothetical protein